MLKAIISKLYVSVFFVLATFIKTGKLFARWGLIRQSCFWWNLVHLLEQLLLLRELCLSIYRSARTIRSVRIELFYFFPCIRSTLMLDSILFAEFQFIMISQFCLCLWSLKFLFLYDKFQAICCLTWLRLWRISLIQASVKKNSSGFPTFKVIECAESTQPVCLDLYFKFALSVILCSISGCFPFAMVIGGSLNSRTNARVAAFVGCFFMTYFFRVWKKNPSRFADGSLIDFPITICDTSVLLSWS